MRAAGCLRSTLTDMIAYAQASLNGARSVQLPCVTSAETAPPAPPEACVSGAPEVEDLLGYAQQRQLVRGPRIPFPREALYEAAFPNVFSDGAAAPAASPAETDGGFEASIVDNDYAPTPAEGAAGPSDTALTPEQQEQLLSLSDTLGGVGLNWLTEDWMDTSASGLKWHDGGTFASNSIILLNPDLDAGIVLLSNFLTDGSTGFSPTAVALHAVDAWWCGGGMCG